MHEGLHASGREFGLDVADQESAGFVVLLQHGVKVRDGESSDEQVGLFVVATAALGLLLIGIHNAWDTVTHIVVSNARADRR